MADSVGGDKRVNKYINSVSIRAKEKEWHRDRGPASEPFKHAL